MSASAVDSIGRYRIVGLLGRGGMGIVYRCETPDGRLVAVKVLREDLEGLDQAIVQRFQREALIRIDHPNIVKVLDSGAVQGNPFIVFELLEGRSLAGVLEGRRKLTPGEVVATLGSVCAGLEAAHAEGVIHRDLKPGNVFCCADGTIKLLDFGVARLKERSSLTLTGAIVGTPAYLSPEQINGRRGVDGRSDLWSLGVIGYEALSGRLPFRQDAPYAVLMSILLEEPTPLTQIAPKVPPELAELIMRCLQKAPADRPASARAVADALAAMRPERWEAPAEDVVISAPASSVSLPVDEQRVVALVLAREVDRADLAYEAIEQQGGVAVPMRENVLGLFGTRTWHGDEVSRAVSAGLACRRHARQVGVGAGRAIGGDRGQGVSGEAVEAAYRASAVALEGVGVDRRSAPAVFGLHDTRVVEGHPDLVEVLGAASGVIRSQTTPLFGREAEVTALQEAWAQANEMQTPTMVVLRGPAGIGKTHIRRTFQAWLTERDIAVLGARGDPAHELRFLWLLGAVIRRDVAARWPELPLPKALRERVRELLGPETVGGLDGAGLLGELLGVSSTETVSLEQAASDPQLMGDMVRLTVEDYLAAVLERGQGALILEDAQFADEATLDLVEGLPDRLGRSPTLALVLVRSDAAYDPAERFALWPSLRVIDVGPLDRAPALELAQLVGGSELSPELADAVVRRAEGNPLYVEHMVLALRHAGHSAQSDLPLPVTVEGAIQSLLQQLSAEERELCKRASIFPQTFDASALAALGLDDPKLTVDRLIERGVLEKRAVAARFELPTFAFRADLVREVASRMLTAEAGRALHGRAAAYLARSPDADPELVADHYDQAGEPTEAAAWYARAAIEASGRGDAPSVLRCTGRALELGAPEHLLFEMHYLRADSLRFLHGRTEQGEELQRAMEVAVTPVQRVRAMIDLAGFLLRTGKAREGLARAASAVREARRIGAPTVRALAHAQHGEALILADRPDQASAAFDRADETLAGTSAPRVASLVAAYRAQLAAVRGDFGASLAWRRRATDLCGQANDLRRAASNQVNAAALLNRHGLYDEAVEALQQAAESGRRVGNRIAEDYARANLGYALVELGRFEEAFAELAEAGAAAARADDRRLGSFVALYQARGRLAAGDAERALAEAALLLESMEAYEEPNVAILARAVAGQAALALRDEAKALEHAEAAMERLERLGTIEEDRAEVYLTYAAALAANGRAAEADEVRQRGRAWLLDAAGRITDDALRRSFLEAVSDNRALLGEA
ncbi:MAG: protein kinase [Sandaracinaceae bacterium]